MGMIYILIILICHNSLDYILKIDILVYKPVKLTVKQNNFMLMFPMPILPICTLSSLSPAHSCIFLNCRKVLKVLAYLLNKLLICSIHPMSLPCYLHTVHLGCLQCMSTGSCTTTQPTLLAIHNQIAKSQNQEKHIKNGENRHFSETSEQP